MSFEIVLRGEAQTELDEIFVWYEDQKQGLGFEFLHAFENTINKIHRNPYYASNVLSDVKGASLKKFPYEVYYRIIELNRQIRIIAVIHQRRNPEWFKRRSRE